MKKESMISNKALHILICRFTICFSGQESAGIVTSTGMDKYRVTSHKGMGLVSQVFKEETVLAKLKGNLGLGMGSCDTSR